MMKRTIEKNFYFTPKMAEKIILLMENDKEAVELSFDLNRTKLPVPLQGNCLILPSNERIKRSALEHVAETEKVYVYHRGLFSPVEVMNDHYYKLVPTEGAPTIEISGVRMHRTKDCEPFHDAKQKVSEVVRRGDVVLDTCGGLGYTAIWSRRFGAERVVSVEIDEHVKAIRQDNPWSSEIFNDFRIELIDGDVFYYINSASSNCFDSILHDPPRFSLAGELYGKEFYSELYRIIKPGGRIFHYTGSPYSRGKKRNFLGGVVRRLHEVGFRTFLKPRKMGVLAIK